MKALYTISIRLYHLAICVASLFNSKAKLFLAGRRDLLVSLEKKISTIRKNGEEIVWFHCASLGEFEQGRPLVELYRSRYPARKILLTFFSPSGFEVRKNYAGADAIFYLPIDTPSNAKRFISIVKPHSAYFVKYEFWFNFLEELKQNEIPTYLVSGIFRDDQYFFSSTGAWFRKQLRAFDHFFLQDEHSLRLLNSIGYQNAEVVGDTRFDRVAAVVSTVREIPVASKLKGDKKMIVAGSTWEEDEKLLAASLSEYRMIIAPHEIDAGHIRSLMSRFRDAVCFSVAEKSGADSAHVLVIDNIGMLSSLYQYGTIAYIGGGFGKGIHNILEAAAFGMPVIFGPNYEKFAEAKELIRLGGAFSVKDETEMKKVMNLLADEQVLRTAAQVSKMYVQSKTGATERILARVAQ